MKHFYIGVSFYFGLLNVCAQKTLWQKDIKSSTQNFLSGMTVTIDRQILLSGSSIQSNNLLTNKNNNGYDYHVVKLAQDGSVLWKKHFGGTRHDYLMSSVSTKEGGFLLTGTSYSNQSGDKKENNLGGSDVWIIRLDENGEELWQKTIGTKSNDEATSIVQSTDEGFFVAGNINGSKQLFGSKDVFVSKLNKEGKLISTTIMGGSGVDEVQEIIATPDGGSLLAIYSTSRISDNKMIVHLVNQNNSSENNSNYKNENRSENLFASLKSQNDFQFSTDQQQSVIFGKSEDNFGEGDYWIVKLDKNANIEWQKSYGGKEDDRPKALAFTDNGYLIVGESRSNASGSKKENIKDGTDVWIVSIDKQGEENWQKNYSFGNRDVAMSLDVIKEKREKNKDGDKGFLIGGYTQAEEKIQTDDEKFWMLYLDTNGKEEWRKHVEAKSKKKEERLVSAQLQNDGTFLLAGTSAEELGQENWKILKLGDKDLDNLIEKQNIRIYPNPVEDYCYVEIGFEFNGEAEIVLHDMTGRLIQNIKTKNSVTKINTSALPQGVYIVTASTPDKSVNSKIVKK